MMQHHAIQLDLGGVDLRIFIKFNEIPESQKPSGFRRTGFWRVDWSVPSEAEGASGLWILDLHPLAPCSKIRTREGSGLWSLEVSVSLAQNPALDSGLWILPCLVEPPDLDIFDG